MPDANAPIGRPVRVMSLSFGGGTKSLDEVAAIIDRETVLPTDIIALPETWAATDNIHNKDRQFGSCHVRKSFHFQTDTGTR